MMKIGYLIPEFPGQTHAFFWREARAMEEAGADIRFLSTRRIAASACPHAFREEATARTRYLFPPSLSTIGWLCLHPIKLARALSYVSGLRETPFMNRARILVFILAAAELVRVCRQESIEHLHIHSCANAAHLGALAYRMDGGSYSLTLHGPLPVYGTDHLSKMEKATFVSTVTRQLREDVLQLLPQMRVPVIWMGVDCDWFQMPAKEPRKPGDPFHIVSVARLNLTKGHLFTLEAIATLVAQGHDIHYKIIGDGPAEDTVRQDAARLGLSDRVEMKGALDEDAVRTALAEADTLALTSFGAGEAAPVAVMEAMASGLPVVVSRIGGTPDMISDGHDGFLVPQQDAVAIGAALEQLVTAPDKALAMGRAARETAQKTFDFRIMAKKLLDEIHQSAAPENAL